MEPASKLSVAVRTLSDEQIADLVRSAVALGVKDALAKISPKPANQPLLTPAQAAEFLGITTDALRKHVGRGNLKPDMRGNRGNGLRGARYSYETLNAFKNRDKRRAADGQR